jgi:predicted dehydrogenase
MAEGTAVDRLNDIIGPKGSLQFGMTAQKAPASFDHKKHGAFTVKTSKGREKVHTYPLKDMFTEQAKHVVKCFARNEQPLVTGTDGIAALEIATAVLKAGKGQRTIKI